MSDSSTPNPNRPGLVILARIGFVFIVLPVLFALAVHYLFF